MSARIGASNEPERPSAAASTLDPVLEDESQPDTSMTALAEPEPEQIETLEGELEAGPVEAGPAEAVSAEAGQPAEAEPSGSTMIVFEDVRKIYEPHVVALDGVSFTIDKGEFVFVVGASGSGKSTMIRLLLKELEPSSGRIIVGGRDLGRLKHSKVPLLRRNVGCVFQDFKLLPNRSAAENVAYALKVQGESRNSIRRKVPEVLSLVGLADKMNSYPDQ